VIVLEVPALELVLVMVLELELELGQQLVVELLLQSYA